MKMNIAYLKPGREKSVNQHHPWIFSGAIEKVKSNPAAGDVVTVVDYQANFLAYGYFNPNSQISIRLLEWDEKIQIDDNWWQSKLKKAIEYRKQFVITPNCNAYRLVFAEADMLPGLIVDQYDDFIVLQALTAGIDKVKTVIANQLNELLHPAGIYERSDMETRTLEGLEQVNGILTGKSPSEHIKITENGYQFLIDIKQGQKTGFYLDQRNNRKIVAEYAKNRDILDCFSYTGGFAVYSTVAGAKSVTRIDSSQSSLNLGTENLNLNLNLSLNPQSKSSCSAICDDVFMALRKYRDSGKKFDMIILDPPKFAQTQARVEKAMRGYKDINLLAIKLLRPGGILATFSCSGGLEMKQFKNVISWASIDAGRETQILQQLSQSLDHPIRAAFPESEYLKGLICQVS